MNFLIFLAVSSLLCPVFYTLRWLFLHTSLLTKVCKKIKKSFSCYNCLHTQICTGHVQFTLGKTFLTANLEITICTFLMKIPQIMDKSDKISDYVPQHLPPQSPSKCKNDLRLSTEVQCWPWPRQSSLPAPPPPPPAHSMSFLEFLVPNFKMNEQFLL